MAASRTQRRDSCSHHQQSGPVEETCLFARNANQKLDRRASSETRRANRSGLMYYRPSCHTSLFVTEVTERNAGQERRGNSAGKRQTRRTACRTWRAVEKNKTNEGRLRSVLCEAAERHKCQKGRQQV